MDNKEPRTDNIPNTPEVAPPAPAIDTSVIEQEPASNDLSSPIAAPIIASDVSAPAPASIATGPVIKESNGSKKIIIALGALLAIFVMVTAVGGLLLASHISQQSVKLNQLKRTSEQDVATLKSENQILTDKSKQLQDDNTKLQTENKQLTTDKAALQKKVDEAASSSQTSSTYKTSGTTSNQKNTTSTNKNSSTNTKSSQSPKSKTSN